MVKTVSYDENPDFYSGIASQSPEGNGRCSMRDLVQAAPDQAKLYFSTLPAHDEKISDLYYIDGLSQEEVGKTLGVSQSAVSHRLNSIIPKLRFFLSRPTQLPVQVAEDFEHIFPPSLVEVAFFFYYEIHSSRVGYLTKTTYSGTTSKFKAVIAYLEKLVALPEHGPYDPAILKEIGVVGPGGRAPADDEVGYKRCLAKGYLEYLLLIKRHGSKMNRPFRKNDEVRKESLEDGESIV